MNKFEYTDSWVNDDGFKIVAGDTIKIKGKNVFGVGEWGNQFRIKHFCTNIDTGAQWVDCHEMFRGRAGALRSFPLDRIKRIPQKRKKRGS